MTIEELLKALGVDVTDENKDLVEGFDEANTKGIKEKRDQFRRERDKAREGLKAMSGLDLEEVRDALGVDELALDELPDLIRTAKAGEKDPKQDQRVVELEAKLERAEKRQREATDQAEARESTLKAALSRKTVETLVTEAVASKDGNITLLKPHLMGRVKTEVTEDGDVEVTVLQPNGEALEDKHGNPASIEQLVAEFANSETFAAAFPADGIGGSGVKETSRVQNQRNPWAKETLNLTEQARIRRENPALAEKLKAAAA